MSERVTAGGLDKLGGSLNLPSRSRMAEVLRQHFQRKEGSQDSSTQIGEVRYGMREIGRKRKQT